MSAWDPRGLRAGAGALGVCLALFAAACLVDPYVRHGLTATWYAVPVGQTERAPVDRTVEHRIEFPNDQRPLARYAQAWDFERFGQIDYLPRLDAVLSARLHVTRPNRTLVARSPSPARVLVDGHELGGQTISEGWHRLDVEWTGAFRQVSTESNVSLALEWRTQDGQAEPVAAEDLVPIDGSWTSTRIALWLFTLLAMLVLGALVARALFSEPPLSWRRLEIVATILVVLLGVGIRLIDYDVMPDFRENDDERFAIWNGYSILEDGTTRGLTLWWPDYAARGETIERVQYWDRNYHVVTPYFEHPPLMHVLVGAAGHLAGAESFVAVKLRHARLVPIALSAIVLLLIVAIGRRLHPIGPAPWLAAFLWAVIPWIAMQTRVVKEDALVAVLGLGSVLAFLRYRDDGRRARDLVLASVLGGACALAKVTGIAFALALAILVTSASSIGAAAASFAIALATASLFLVFGAVIDWDAFVFTQGLQSGRPVHFNIFLRFFDSPLINHNLVGRGWLLFLWLAGLPYLARGHANAAAIGVPLVTYLAAIGLGSGTWTFGWYVTPMLPLLCLAAGQYFADLWRRPDLVRGALVVMVLVFYSLNFVAEPGYWKIPANWPDIRRIVTLALAAGLAPFAIAQGFRGALGRAVGRFGVISCMAVLVLMSVYFVAHYDVITTTFHDFDRDRYFDR